MDEKLYVVNTNMSDESTVIATIEKKSDRYIYQPMNLDKDNWPRARKVIESKGLPDIAQRRLYSKRRPDIDRILAKYGLNRYDEWELLKRTKGRLMTDKVQYLTENEMLELKAFTDPSENIVDSVFRLRSAGSKSRKAAIQLRAKDSKSILKITKLKRHL